MAPYSGPLLATNHDLELHHKRTALKEAEATLSATDARIHLVGKQIEAARRCDGSVPWTCM